ncbi:hypothetical protein [Prochlorococcus marinus]|nr:hypothetical protein [Prochlorococcus marinus]
MTGCLSLVYTVELAAMGRAVALKGAAGDHCFVLLAALASGCASLHV